MNKIFNKKNSTVTVALVVMMTLAILAAAAPLSNAQNLLNHTTYIYVVAEPNPVGVSQTTYISYFLPDVPPAQFPTVAPRYGTWDGITVTVTKPDGTVQTFANISTSYAGSGTISYVPSLVGTYTIMASFPGQTITTGSSRGQYYGPSTSPIATFNVTTQPLPPAISYPLPTNYWTYPIEGQNQAWNIYSGNWLAGNFPNASMTSPWNPWTVGPYSAHILWSQTWLPGGLVGGNYQSQLYYSGRWPGGSNQYFCPFIANGIMYTNLPVYYLNSSGTAQPAGFEAMNLATGQVIWKNTATNDAINYLQILDFGQSTMAQGTYQLLWSTSGSSWRTYDPLTGNLLQTIANVTSGGKVTFGPNGEFMIYFVNANGWMAAWNSTIFEGAVAQQVGWTYNPIYSPNTVYEVCQGTYNFPLGFQWNITIPKQSGISITNGVLPNDLIIASTSIAATNSTSTALQQIAFSIKPNQYTSIGPNSQGLGAIQNNTGNQAAQVLWGPINRTTYVDNGGYERIETIAYANNGIPVFVMYSREKLQMVAYNAYTGAYMYTTQPFENAFAMFTGESNNIQAADGKLFAGDYDGTMHCYDLATGNLLWEYYVGNAGLNTPYGTWVIDGSYSYYDIAGGMVIMGANEHSPNNPTWLGGQIWAVNETSGQLIWKITSFQDETQPIAAVENQVIYLNYYDGKLYDIGRGPSATTVSAPENVQPLNSPVLIKGTVTDQSIGAIGTPAISDSSMTPWMEYLYMQKPKPTNATGVQVTLTTLDPNNNIETIGTVTSDTNGNYGISWTPPVPGLYKITATFSGTNSYWGSDSTTYLIVGAAATSQASANPTATITPPTSPTSTPTQTVSPSPSQAPQPTSGMPIVTYIAIAAAVVIIALIATAVVLRRRK